MTSLFAFLFSLLSVHALVIQGLPSIRRSLDYRYEISTGADLLKEVHQAMPEGVWTDGAVAAVAKDLIATIIKQLDTASLNSTYLHDVYCPYGQRTAKMYALRSVAELVPAGKTLELISKLEKAGEILFSYGAYSPLPDVQLQPVQHPYLKLKTQWYYQYVGESIIGTATALKLGLNMKYFTALICSVKMDFATPFLKHSVDEIGSLTYWKKTPGDKVEMVRDSVESMTMVYIGDSLATYKFDKQALLKSICALQKEKDLPYYDLATQKETGKFWMLGTGIMGRLKQSFSQFAESSAEIADSYKDIPKQSVADYLKFVSQSFRDLSAAWLGEKSFKIALDKVCSTTKKSALAG